MTIFFSFDFGDCVMGGWVDSPRYPLGTIVESSTGVFGAIVAQWKSGGCLIYRLQNMKYLRDPMAAETAIEKLRRKGWTKIATLRDGVLRSTIR